MSDTNYRLEPDRITIYPHWGTGWQTVLRHLKREIVMQPCFLWFKFPLRRKVPYSQVAQVATVCRESWWSWALTPLSGWFGHSLLGGGRPEYTAMPGKGWRPEYTAMPGKGWRHDILITLKGGRKPIKIGTVKSPDTASELGEELRQRLGLSET